MSEPARRFVEEVRQAQRHRKFARLTIAEIMTVETNARGQTTCLTIPKQELVSCTADLEKLPLPLNHGTLRCRSRRDDDYLFSANSSPRSSTKRPGRTACCVQRCSNSASLTRVNGKGGSGRDGILKIGSLAGLEPVTSCVRSEEHTSELQSLTNLVCRL